MKYFNARGSLKSLRASTLIFLGALLFAILATSSTVSAQVVVSVAIAPPALPVYTQPICPGEGFIWTPGYWGYSDDGGYFWVPGTWVEAPEVGLLWTPGYWGWNDRAYVWNEGYWGPQVGFYGGINYGFGYVGTGYAGGYWSGSNFYYNRRVNNVDVNIVHNVYQKNVVVVNSTHVSFNGGRGGVRGRPTAAQETFLRERHIAPTTMQERHESTARADRSQFASVNHGHPAVVATQKPDEFKGPGLVQTRASNSERINNGRTETKATSKPRTESSARTESKSRTESKPETKSRTESKPAAPHESRTETKPRTESKPTTTHEPKTEAKPRAESKPAAPHESKPEAKP